MFKKAFAGYRVLGEILKFLCNQFSTNLTMPWDSNITFIITVAFVSSYLVEVWEISRSEDLQSTYISFEELQQQKNNPTLIEHNESFDCLSDSIIKKQRTTNGYDKQNKRRSKETR